MKFIFALGLVITISWLSLTPGTARAWTHRIHETMCPKDYNIDCAVADSPSFINSYPYADHANHLCFDNKANCQARILAKYYLKKYYVEDKQDPNLLGAAAHLMQDAACPDHWYPMRDFFGKTLSPLAPSWVGDTEGVVENNRANKPVGWLHSVRYKGEEIIINQAYLNEHREAIGAFLAQEPVESLAEIEAQLKTAERWAMLRSLKEMLFLVLIILLLPLAYTGWKWKTKKKGLIDLIIISTLAGTIICLLLITQLFY